MDAHAHDANLCLEDLLKPITNRAYACYVNLKPSMVHDWEHLVSLFSTNFLHAEAKCTLVELDKSRQYLGEDLDVYVRRFHEKALDYYNLLEEEIFINVFLPGMMEEYRILLEAPDFTSKSFIPVISGP